MITCDVTPEQISAYYDEELAGAAQAKMELHVASCPHCQQELAAVAAMSTNIGQTLQSFQAPSWIEQVVMAAIGEQIDAYQAVRMKWGTFIVALMMALGVFGIAFSPLGRLVWSIARILLHGGRTVFRTLLNLPFGAGTGLFSSSFVIVCFAFAIVCAVAVFGLSRRWRTA